MDGVGKKEGGRGQGGRIRGRFAPPHVARPPRSKPSRGEGTAPSEHGRRPPPRRGKEGCGGSYQSGRGCGQSAAPLAAAAANITQVRWAKGGRGGRGGAHRIAEERPQRRRGGAGGGGEMVVCLGKRERGAEKPQCSLSLVVGRCQSARPLLLLLLLLLFGWGHKCGKPRASSGAI